MTEGSNELKKAVSKREQQNAQRWEWETLSCVSAHVVFRYATASARGAKRSTTKSYVKETQVVSRNSGGDMMGANEL